MVYQLGRHISWEGLPRRFGIGSRFNGLVDSERYGVEMINTTIGTAGSSPDDDVPHIATQPKAEQSKSRLVVPDVPHP